jgi:glutamate synthase domain-containing protein 1/glutamate synthase domain-containing protein 3
VSRLALDFKNGRLPSREQMTRFTDAVLAYRRQEAASAPALSPQKTAEEGGCGVVGFAANVPVSGRHIFEPSVQMHNRGNGKGGGIAAAGLEAAQLGVDPEVLKNDYILQVALLDPQAENEVEAQHIAPHFVIHHKSKVDTIDDYRDLGLEVKPPDVVRYFVRVKDAVLQKFADETGLAGTPPREIEDEFVYRNSRELNNTFYTSLGDKRAFVLSHARDLCIFKIVGYAENVVRYYVMDDFKAKVWIAHQRYPTKGRVWHPGGSHPFIGMNEALVHNGDFANYFSVSEYLRQHGIATQFLTDTEVAVLLFDLWTRVYKYPLEYVIEAMAPTTELDFEQLSAERQNIYRNIQALHMHGSPDGPWFFIIARSNPDDSQYQLLGITDTAMLRPQVFALQEGDVSIGLVGSEKQAIDATLLSLHAEDPRFRLVADRYWNARGGSHTDGGAFGFTVNGNGDGYDLTVADKFGKPILGETGEWRLGDAQPSQPAKPENLSSDLKAAPEIDPAKVFAPVAQAMSGWSFAQLSWFIGQVEQVAEASDDGTTWALDLLTLLNNRRYDTGGMKRSMVLQLLRLAINRVLDSTPAMADNAGRRYARIDWDTQDDLRPPAGEEEVLVVYAHHFQPEGDDCDARLEVNAFRMGWKHFILYGLKGQRFQGCGLGPNTKDVRFDFYGASGDYLASGIDGMEMHIHDNGQDQLGQVMKQGTLVVHGDVGQAFMYGAKGGDVFVMGNGAGRPLINGVGRPRVVINGTCLDFLAESFMAGDPHNGGGFVVLNGVAFDPKGKVIPLPSPYQGANLFSLASGGAIFVRDPEHKLVDKQLNGAQFLELTQQDWDLILPYLEANERHFGISVEEDLLVVDGVKRSPLEVYRKVVPLHVAVLAKQLPPE